MTYDTPALIIDGKSGSARVQLWHRNVDAHYVQTKISSTAYLDIRNTAIAAGLRAFGMSLGFLTSLLLARWLGVDGFGVYSYTVACIVIATSVGIAGIDRLLVRNLSVYKTSNSPELYRGQLVWAIRTGLILSTFAGLTAAALVAGRFPAFSPSPFQGEVPYSAGWRLVCGGSTFAIVVLTVLMRILQTSPRSAGLMVRSLLPESVVLSGLELSGLIAVAWFCAWHLDIRAVLLVYASSALIAALWASTYLRSSIPATTDRDQYLPAEWRRAAWALTLVVGGSMLIDQVDVVVLGLLRSAHDVSLYSAADKGAAIVAAPLAAVQLALSPVLAQLWASKDQVALAATVRRGSLITTVAGFVIVALLLGPGPWFLALFGTAFKPSYNILAILCAGQLVNAATGIVGSLLIMSNHEITVARINGACLVLNIALAIPCIHVWGAVGAAMATSIVMAVRNIAFAWTVRRRLGIDGSILAAVPGVSK